MKANMFAKGNEGVSAVIGVILMVAITVILAAVIATFVFGMTGGVQQKKFPAFIVHRVSHTEIQLTLHDKSGMGVIDSLVIAQPGTMGDYIFSGGPAGTNIINGAYTTPGSPAPGFNVGDIIDIKTVVGNNNLRGSVHLIVTAVVSGNRQVIIDNTVTDP